MEEWERGTFPGDAGKSQLLVQRQAEMGQVGGPGGKDHQGLIYKFSEWPVAAQPQGRGALLLGKLRLFRSALWKAPHGSQLCP